MKIKTNNKSIRVVVAEDCKPMLETIVGLLTPHFKVVGTGVDGKIALEMINHLKPDIAVLDISMPFKTGIEIAADLKARASEVKVVIISAHDDESYICAASRSGALAYVVKTTLADALIPALESAYALPSSKRVGIRRPNLSEARAASMHPELSSPSVPADPSEG